MNIDQFEKQFEEILSGNSSDALYEKEDYQNYVKLNQSRIKRWVKTAQLSAPFVEAIKAIDEPQHWVLITEPWCGDAANNHAFIKKAVELNPNITLEVQNRDAENSEIDQYLTNGGKSIPKLIVRDADHKDLFNWGPRPKAAQELYLNTKDDETMTSEEKKIAIQNWYNKDKGVTLQEELTKHLAEIASRSTA